LIDIQNPVLKSIWKDRYQKNGETIQGNIERVAKYIATDSDEYDSFYDVMSNGYFLPAGRTMSNAAIGESLTLNNCFLHPIIEDSMEGIFDAVKCGAITHKAGGGIGYDFSQIRPNGTATSNQAIASGVVSFMDVFNAQTATVMQGSRRGANMGVLSIYHPDIYEFIHAKAKDTNKLNHFNLSVMVDDAFMKAVENDESICLHYPVYDEQYHIITDKSKWLQSKEVRAVELWNSIMKLAYNNGEPGVLFYDNMNKDNNTWYVETITHTNPCGEFVGGTVFGGDLPSNNYGGACNLGSLFLHNFVRNPFTNSSYFDFSELARVVPVAVRMLDNIIDINKYPLPHYENYQKNLRTIGLGVTGLADTLVMLGYKYNSTEAVEFIDSIMESIAICAYTASINLSKERGCFNFFDADKFVQSGYILKHMSGKNPESWKQIKEDICTYGIRNARLMSVAPTGTLSLTFGNNCSSGIEPIFSLEYNRQVKIGGQDDNDVQEITIRDYAYDYYQSHKSVCSVNENVFVTALDMTVNEHVDMLAAIAKHVDMSVSKTINVPTDYSFEDTKNIYMKCWKSGIKGCTIFRPNEVRQGILIDNSSKDHKAEEEVKVEESLLRGDWKPKAIDTTYYQRKLHIGCGKLFLFIGWSDSEQSIQDFYVTRSGQGGCERLLQAAAISMSAIFRLGGNIDNIEKAFRGVGGCNSFATQRGKGVKLSSGSSCGTAILNELKAFLKERSGDLPRQKQIKDAKKDSSINIKASKCPECGQHTLVFEGGCNCCKNCGFSSCG
jgi:ribonucleoside-diphosphate reductase alpha chain